ncbi:3-methyladenine DNA glycosylase [Microbacterium panaciterrae]|uniref:3-methyladenine DNA glycosylase n=1 Tax=Microbacterium panaciterrae TaxID=985759 RepID=A0ABP8PA87_9MICO
MTAAMPGSPIVRRRLDREVWSERAGAHAERADLLTAAHRERRARGETHPVHDFLFTYYGYKPGQLRRWHPGAGVTLEGAAERAAWRWYSPDPAAAPDAFFPDAAAFAADKPELARLVRAMLARTAARPGQFGCFGLHEWAMVYRTPEHRHEVPLRLGQAGTDAVVEAGELRCTHIDAFRFFTPEAVPRNRLAPTRETQPLLEQPGCLHAGMDVYKWAMKLGPLVDGETLLDAFELARDIRILDMEAAPYDLSNWGVEPVRIETPEGKAEYVRRQRGFAQRGTALRARILHAWLGEEFPALVPSDQRATAS